MNYIRKVLSFAVGVLVIAGAAFAADWPTYLHDNSRSGITSESLTLPLHEQWVFKSRQAPRPAWPGPAKQDVWHEIRELKPEVTYDRVFHTVLAADAVYFASSGDDQVYCLDARTGAKRWSFFAEGPVRLAPVIAEGKLYFGADDGCVYCLDAADGKLVWQFRPPAPDRRIPGNGRIISDTPVRTGLVVDGGVVYGLAGLFPPDGVFGFALDAATGKSLACQKIGEVSPQGYLLANATRLFISTGRTAPAMFDRQDLAFLGMLEGAGGAFAVLTNEGVTSGPGRRTGDMVLADGATKESIASFDGVRMVVNGDMAYLQSKEDIAALDRGRYIALSRELKPLTVRHKKLDDLLKDLQKGQDTSQADQVRGEIAQLDAAINDKNAALKACYLWKVPWRDPYALILVGGVLFAGGESKVAAFQPADGKELWSATIPGSVYGLSAANGRLLASTSLGGIHCFAADPIAQAVVNTPAEEPSPYPADAQAASYAAAAERIVADTGIKKGYCIVLGCGEGRLVYELARRTDLHIIGIEADAAKAAHARENFEAAGLYGARVAVHCIQGPALPYTSYLANLIIVDTLDPNALKVSPAEVFRVTRPYGGQVYAGFAQASADAATEQRLAAWTKECGFESPTIVKHGGLWAAARRGAVPGAGEWTQLYATPNHTACSVDELRGPMAIQWFGEPGPRDIIDRHHRPVSSMFKDGRVFVPGDNQITAIDAYNGTPLWRLDIPDSRRVAALKSGGHMLVTSDYLYVAVQDQCWAIRVADGAPAFSLPAPQMNKEPHYWGYLNTAGDNLVGSGQKPSAAFTTLSVATVNTIEGDFRPIVASDYLFCVNHLTGKKKWIYTGGAIFNNGITIDDGCVFFVESRNEKALSSPSGKIRINDFCASDAYLVALNLKNGKKVWERPVQLPFQHILYLNGADKTLLATGSFNENGQVFYQLFGFDMATGADKWTTRFRATDVRGTGFAETDGSHGEQWQHPVIIDGTIYQRPFAFDLATGQKKDYVAYRGGHGCGGLTGSAHYLYGRGSNPRMYPIEATQTEGIPLTLISRPGCWLNIIPAGGIVVIPESSAGCTCAYPMQTSLSLIPTSALAAASPSAGHE